MKNLTKQDVLAAAVALMNANGSTTSKDVKTQLRIEDFKANQSEVGEFLRELQIEQNWSKDFNGVYNTYTLVSVSASAPSVSAPSIIDDCKNFIKETLDVSNGISPDLHPLGKNELPTDQIELMKLAINLDSEFGTSVRNNDLASYETVYDICMAVSTEILNDVSLLSNFRAQVTKTVQQIQKSRKPRMIINDSATPSKSNRVTINIDVKADPFDSTTTVKPNDWFVRPSDFGTSGIVLGGSSGNVTPNCASAIFDEKYSSDNVRTVFARLYSVDFANVRACRMKRVKLPSALETAGVKLPAIV